MIRQFNIRTKQPGGNIMLTTGIILSALVAAPLCIDMPMYYNVRQQLQTAVDAAALGGAAKLPYGQSSAETFAKQVAAQNKVMGAAVEASALSFSYGDNNSSFSVRGQVEMPTLTRKLMCSIQAGLLPDEEDEENLELGAQETNCDAMTVYASAKAEPAARDTMLVIDTSSSMADLGSGRPFSDVKQAANSYIDQVSAFNNTSVDRIGVVKFDQSGSERIGLTSKQESPNFSAVKTAVTNLTMFSGSGWNTNYEVGLRLALDELEQNGRSTSNKQIIFLTDGKPNLPAPASYYSYSSTMPYKKCTNMVEQSSAVQALCYTNSRGQRVCPTLPSSQITNAMISSAAQQCGQDYVNHMAQVTDTQSQRAAQLGVTIYVIEISDSEDGTGGSTSNQILKRLIKNPNWDPPQLQNMVTLTGGKYKWAANYDATAINTIYQDIAKELRIKLSS